MWCGVVWCGVVCGVVWCGMVVWYGGVVWCDVVWCGVGVDFGVVCGLVCCGVVWCVVVWCGVEWCGGMGGGKCKVGVGSGWVDRDGRQEAAARAKVGAGQAEQG